jgi:hypothetical protein
VRTETVEFHSDDLNIVATVRSTTGLDEMRRHRIQFEQSKIEDSDPDRKLLRQVAYPDVLSCVKFRINDVEAVPTLEQYAEWPGVFTFELEHMIYTVNPHWAGMPEKKATT